VWRAVCLQRGVVRCLRDDRFAILSRRLTLSTSKASDRGHRIAPARDMNDASTRHARVGCVAGCMRITTPHLGLLSVTKSWAVADTGRTLHRAPPLMRIFFPVSLVRSYIVTRAPVVAAKYAAVSPAAPPPSTATSVELLLLAKGPLADEACERDPSPGDDVVCSAAVLLLLAMLTLRPVEDALRSRNRKRTIR